MKPGKPQSTEQTKMPRFLLEGPRPCTTFCFSPYTIDTLFVSYVIKAFLLDSSSVSSKQLSIVYGARSRPKKRRDKSMHTTKNSVYF